MQKTLTLFLKPSPSEAFFCCDYVHEKREKNCTYPNVFNATTRFRIHRFLKLSSCRRQLVNGKNVNLTSEKKAIEKRWCRVERVERERCVNWRDKMSDLYRLYYSLLCLCLLSPPSALTDSFRPV